MKFFDLLFGKPNASNLSRSHRPDGTPPTATEGLAVRPDPKDDPIKLAIFKAVKQACFIMDSYGLGPVTTSIDDMKADLEIMLRYGDLTSMRLEVLGRDGRVVYEWKNHFASGQAVGGRLVDSGQGVELPILDRKLLKGHRLVIQRAGRDAGYRHLLRLNWGDAPVIQKAQGDQFESEHAARITGGRQRAMVHVGDEARHRLIVVQTGSRGFAFAQDLDGGFDRVFVLAKHWPPGADCRVGTRFTGVLVQTPRGIQVRSIRSS